MADAVRKVSICFILSEFFGKPGQPLNLVPFCENLIFYSLEFVCTYLDFLGINVKLILFTGNEAVPDRDVWCWCRGEEHGSMRPILIHEIPHLLCVKTPGSF